jgi:hypothetical protein
MAIDLDRIRKRKEALNQKNERNNILWKPKPGENVVRIVPYTHEKGYPFIELMFHYGVNGKNYLSPTTFGKKDPLAEFGEKLRNSGDKDEYEMSKQLTPRMRTYAPVVVRGEENEGVKFWGFGKTVYEELLTYISNPDYGDITDPKEGRDITVVFKTAKEAGKNFPETKIMVKPNQTVVTEDKSLVEKIKNQPKITTIFKEPSLEDLDTALQTWLNGGEESDEPTDSDIEESTANAEKVTASEPTAKKSSGGDSTDDIADQFESMWDDES